VERRDSDVFPSRVVLTRQPAIQPFTANEEGETMQRPLTVVVCAFLFLGTLCAQTNIANKFVCRSQTYNATTLPYRLFIPDGYSVATRYPLMLVLHSAGERGNDNNLLLTNTRMATTWADSVAQLSRPCFVVAPQCPQGGGWSSGDPTAPIRPEGATVIAILDPLVRKFSIDTNRVYVTGFSRGEAGHGI
jgi:predicted peptidase